MYAIFQAGGKQFKAEKGATLQLPRMADQPPGSSISFEQVLLASDGSTVKVGQPFVAGAKVQAEVLGEAKGPKIYVFKFKRRKNYRRKTGHRQKYTAVRVTDVTVG